MHIASFVVATLLKNRSREGLIPAATDNAATDESDSLTIHFPVETLPLLEREERTIAAYPDLFPPIVSCRTLGIGT